MEMWNKIDFIKQGTSMKIGVSSMVYSLFLKELLQSKQGHLSEISDEGFVKKEDDDDAILNRHHKLMMDKGGRLLYKYLLDQGNQSIYIFDHGMVDIEINETYVKVEAASLNEEFIQELREYFNQNWYVSPDVPIGKIYAIMKQGHNLNLSYLGAAGVPLIEGNYTPKVVEDYKYIVKDLQSQYPSGRIAIIHGTPGSGKTFIIKSLLAAVPDAMFVLVSPDMVSSLGGPEFLPLLLSNRSENHPIILLLEDADKCLVARDKENMGAIQALLNLGDGILGSLLDLRIVATTNADKLEMEKALIRPGRLSKIMEVGALDLLTAKNVFHRLLSEVKNISEVKTPPQLIGPKDFKMTLAEVYSLARQYGWVSSIRKMDDNDNENEWP